MAETLLFDQGGVVALPEAVLVERVGLAAEVIGADVRVTRWDEVGRLAEVVGRRQVVQSREADLAALGAGRGRVQKASLGDPLGLPGRFELGRFDLREEGLGAVVVGTADGVGRLLAERLDSGIAGAEGTELGKQGDAADCAPGLAFRTEQA